MTILLDIINSINKFLGYLDISPKYLNRAYTILSAIPTFYILRIVRGLWKNDNYVQFTIYLLVFILAAYFLLLNFFYYFFDKNLKIDITQLFVKYLPDDAFNIKEESQVSQRTLPNAQEVPIAFEEDSQLRLVEYMQELIEEEKIETNDLSQLDGFLIRKNTLFPYYYLKKKTATDCEIQIGKSYHDLETIGQVHHEEELHPIGLFIVGGDFSKEGIRYHEPYQLKLMVKKEEATPENSRSSRRQKNK